MNLYYFILKDFRSFVINGGGMDYATADECEQAARRKMRYLRRAKRAEIFQYDSDDLGQVKLERVIQD